jgi:large subunit ribosomal protein L9
MKVILTSKVKTLGNVGDIKVVADGYGRNYLLSKKLAIIYSESNYKFFEERKKFIEVENIINLRKAEEIREIIEKKEFLMVASAGENDRLYGSINATTIANFVNQLIGEKCLRKSNLSIQKPIKTLGEFDIEFNLHPEVSFARKLTVVRIKEKVENSSDRDNKKD